MENPSNRDILLDEAVLYENILERVPDDLFSLERLAEIWRLCGEDEKQNFCLHQIAQVKSGGKLEAMPSHAKPMVEATPLHTVFASAPVVNDRPRPARPNVRSPKSSSKNTHPLLSAGLYQDVRLHIDLFIRLFEWKQLSNESFVFLMRSLGRLDFSSASKEPQGALHLLKSCEGINYNKILEALKMTSGLEQVDLLEFSDYTVISELPRELIYNLEVVVFSKSKDKVCIAMLNPYNTAIKHLLEDYYALPLEFFLADVDSFDTFIMGDGTYGAR